MEYECIHCGEYEPEHVKDHWERCVKHPAHQKLAELQSELAKADYATRRAVERAEQAEADIETGDRMYEELQADWHKTLDEKALLKKELNEAHAKIDHLENDDLMRGIVALEMDLEQTANELESLCDAIGRFFEDEGVEELAARAKKTRQERDDYSVELVVKNNLIKRLMGVLSNVAFEIETSSDGCLICGNDGGHHRECVLDPVFDLLRLASSFKY